MKSTKQILVAGLTIIILSITFQLYAKPQENLNTGNMNKIEIGDTIPDIVLKDQTGKLFDLKANTADKNVVLYFYPKDDTKGCTEQACTFRDQLSEFKGVNAVVIGISGQSVESHKEFADKYNLPFTLLSDEDDKVRQMFGVPASFFGLLPGRVTYVINKKHKVISVFNSQLKIKEHINNALESLKEQEN